MSKFLCKFRITELGRVEGWKKNAHPDPEKHGTDTYLPTEHCRVKLTAVQSDPFGPATPSGSVEMVIQNEAVVKLLNEVGPGVEMYAMFQVDHGGGWE